MTSEKRKAERGVRSRERIARAEQAKVARARERVAERRQELANQWPSLSFNLKLDRASKHIGDLGEATKTWLETDAYRFVPETNPQTGRTVINAHISKPPTPSIALNLGDTVHNLRSALDHLVFELVAASYRPRLVPRRIEKASEFPIFPHTKGNELGVDLFHCVNKKTGEPVPSSGLHKLRGLDPGAIEAIEGIQPYHRGPAYAEDPLWVIHELDRIDKHRRLNLTAYALGSVGLSGAGTGNIEYLHIEQMGHDGPVHHGTVVGSLIARNADFELNFGREIALAESSLPEGGFVPGAIADLRDYVRDQVIPPLKPFLTS